MNLSPTDCWLMCSRWGNQPADCGWTRADCATPASRIELAFQPVWTFNNGRRPIGIWVFVIVFGMWAMCLYVSWKGARLDDERLSAKTATSEITCQDKFIKTRTLFCSLNVRSIFINVKCLEQIETRIAYTRNCLVLRIKHAICLASMDRKAGCVTHADATRHIQSSRNDVSDHGKAQHVWNDIAIHIWTYKDEWTRKGKSKTYRWQWNAKLIISRDSNLEWRLAEHCTSLK